jgi:hypothetical protein
MQTLKLYEYVLVICDGIIAHGGLNGNILNCTAPKSFIYSSFVNNTKKGRTTFEDVLFYLRGAEIIISGGLNELTLDKKKYVEFLRANKLKSKFTSQLGGGKNADKKS